MVPNTGATLRISSIACVLLSFYKTVSTAKDYLQRTNNLTMPISKRVHALLIKEKQHQTNLFGDMMVQSVQGDKWEVHFWRNTSPHKVHLIQWKCKDIPLERAQ